MATTRKTTTAGGRRQVPAADRAAPSPREATDRAVAFVEIRPGLLVNPAQVVTVRLLRGGVDPDAYATMTLASGAEETLTCDAFMALTGREPHTSAVPQYRGPALDHRDEKN